MATAAAAIVGAEAIYALPNDFFTEGPSVDQIKCTPITLYQSEPPASDFLGAQIAASTRFISYAIKGGKIRVLARRSATRTLLRGHSATIVDLAFSDVECGAGALLASCCVAGDLVVWQVHEGTDEVLYEKEITLAACNASRVAWRPAESVDRSLADLALAAGDVARLLRDPVSARATPTPAWVSLPHGARIFDIRWSSDGEALLTAAADGRARHYVVRCGPIQMRLSSRTSLRPRRQYHVLARPSS
jgi:WD40 repeat protein